METSGRQGVGTDVRFDLAVERRDAADGPLPSALDDRPPRPRRGRRRQWPALVVVTGSLGAAWIGMLLLIRAQGIGITGDEPHYLVEAISIGRFHTLNMNPGYVYAVLHHEVYPWNATPGPHLAALIGQSKNTLWHHHLYLPFHAIGLSVILAVPMLFGTSTAVIALIVILALLTTALLYLTGEASGATSPARNLVGFVYLAPPFMLAAVQVYPDLITGLDMAIVIMAIALIETRHRSTRTLAAALTACLVVLPWLDQKNILFVAPLLLATAVTFVRTGLPRRLLSLVALPTLLSLLSLVTLNLYAFGDALGGPQRIELTSFDTLTRALALLVDRRQGLLVQAPVVLLGFAGLWIMRKRIPIAAITGLVIVGATIYGNATQPDSFGGYSFVGRFQWPTLPILFAFAGLTLLHLWRVRRSAAVVAAIVALASFASPFALVLRREHVFYNGAGWDPSTYAGWLGGLDPSPILGYVGRDGFLNARVDWGLVCVVALAALIIGGVVVAARSGGRWWRWTLLLPAVAVSLSYPMTLSATPLQPLFARPASFVPLQPVTVCDTRPGNPSHLLGPSAQCSDGRRGDTVRPGAPLTFAVAGEFGVPAHHLTAVAIDLTTVNATAQGAVTVSPGGQTPPALPTFVTSATEPISHFAVVSVGSRGTVAVTSTVTTDVVVELEGFTSSSARSGGLLYHPLVQPLRLCPPVLRPAPASASAGCALPTPTGGNPSAAPGLLPVPPLRPIALAVPRRSGAAELRITTLGARGAGTLAVSSSGVGAPRVPVVHFTAYQSITNTVIVAPGPTGTITLVSSAPTDAVVDLVGTFTSSASAGGSRFTPEIAPVRICDTRGSNPSDLSGPATQCDPGTSNSPKGLPLAPGKSRRVHVAGLGYVPARATAAELAVTPVPSYSDSLTMSSTSLRSGARPTAPDPAPGGYADGIVVAALGRHGSVVVTNTSDAPVDLTIDLLGWYEP